MRRILPTCVLAVVCFLALSFQSPPAQARHGWCGVGMRSWCGPSYCYGWGGPRFACGYRSFGYSYGCAPLYYNSYCPTYYSSYYSAYPAYYGGYVAPYSWFGDASAPAATVVNYRPVVVLPPKVAAAAPAPRDLAPAIRELAPAIRDLAPAPRDATVAKAPVKEPRVRESPLEARRRADRYIALGDKLFVAQKYQEALQQYKSATAAAPDLAATYFRQGFALLATNRYEMAATAFRRGLAVEPDYVASDFRLDRVYGENRLAKSSHLEALAGSALDRPLRSDLLFAIGVFLHYDGQADRAQKFFHQAANIAGPEDRYVALFLVDSPTIPTSEHRPSDGSEI